MFSTVWTARLCKYKLFWLLKTLLQKSKQRSSSITFQILTFERISWFGEKGIGKYPLRFCIVYFLFFLSTPCYESISSDQLVKIARPSASCGNYNKQKAYLGHSLKKKVTGQSFNIFNNNYFQTGFYNTFSLVGTVLVCFFSHLTILNCMLNEKLHCNFPSCCSTQIYVCS